MITLENVSKSYAKGQPALNDVSLHIDKGEFVFIVGNSGSGKSTLIKLLLKELEPTSGTIIVNDQNLGKMKRRKVPKYRRGVGVVFQDFRLLKDRNVYENVAFAQRVIERPNRVIKKRVPEILTLVGLAEKYKSFPRELSGGEQQRVALARAIVTRPKVLLLDEPLSAIDAKLRKSLQVEIRRIQKQLNITTIFVTHDQEEALTMSDTIVVMDKGSIQQIGTPEDIYNEPKNAFVADFIGESNIIDGVMYEDFEVEFAGQAFKCVDKGFAENERVDVVIRPEDIIVGDYETSPISGEVESVIFKGVHYEITVDAHGYKWLIHSTQSQPVGAHIGMNVRPEDIHIMKKMEA